MDTFETIAALIRDRVGFTLSGEKAHRIEVGVRQRMTELGIERAKLYLEQVQAPGGRTELDRLAEAVTVNETYFFRHPEQWNLLAGWVKKRSTPTSLQPLRVLSAGCSTGEEAYTAAMLLHDTFPLCRPQDFSVTAVDLDSEALERAREGSYWDWSVKRGEIPEAFLERYFVAQDHRYRVTDTLRPFVSFERKNLMTDDLGGPYELVLCRNVLIYFQPEHKRRAIDNLVRSLRLGGILFCGYGESLADYSHYLELRDHQKTNYYVRWSPDRRGGLAEASLDSERRQFVEESGIPLIFFSGGNLMIAGVLASNMTPDELRDRLQSKQKAMMGHTGTIHLDFTGLRYAEEDHLRVLSEFVRGLTQEGSRFETAPASHPRLAAWFSSLPQRDWFRPKGSSLDLGQLPTRPQQAQPTPGRTQDRVVPSQDLTPRPQCATRHGFRHIRIENGASAPRVVIRGPWPDCTEPTARLDLERDLLMAVASLKNTVAADQAKVILDLSELDYAETWLAGALSQFKKSIHPRTLAVVGGMGTLRWLGRSGLRDIV